MSSVPSPELFKGTESRLQQRQPCSASNVVLFLDMNQKWVDDTRVRNWSIRPENIYRPEATAVWRCHTLSCHVGLCNCDLNESDTNTQICFVFCFIMALRVDCALFLLEEMHFTCAPMCLHHVGVADISGVTSRLQGCGLTSKADRGPFTWRPHALCILWRHSHINPPVA